MGSPRKAKKRPAPRTRRTAAEARELILEAASRRLSEGGPAALRLQELAEDLGISHPTILHHFGSREALVQDVLARGMRKLQEEVLGAVMAEPFDEASSIELLRRSMDAFVGGGHARLFAWLALEGGASGELPDELLVMNLARAVHLRRTVVHGEAPFEDTLFVVLSISLALLGESLVGERAWKTSGLEPGARGRFLDWLLARAAERLERGAAKAGPRKR